MLLSSEVRAGLGYFESASCTDRLHVFGGLTCASVSDLKTCQDLRKLHSKDWRAQARNGGDWEPGGPGLLCFEKVSRNGRNRDDWQNPRIVRSRCVAEEWDSASKMFACA